MGGTSRNGAELLRVARAPKPDKLSLKRATTIGVRHGMGRPTMRRERVRERADSHARRLQDALEGRLDGYLRTDPASRALWSTDGSIYLRRPVGVVVARTEGDVRKTLAAAREIGLSVTPRGTGTSLAGQATAPGLTLDTTLMQQVFEVNPEERRCFLETGGKQREQKKSHQTNPP